MVAKGEISMNHTVKTIMIVVVTIFLLPVISANARSLSEKLKVPAADVVQMLTLDDGSTLVGRITSVNDKNIIFETDLGTMNIEITRIRAIKEVSPSALRDGKYWFPNPNRTRLLLGPTARTLEAGSGYLFDLWIFLPGVAYAITDNFMVSGGVSIIPGADDQLFYLIPKYGFPVTDKFDLAFSLNILHLWETTAFLGMGSMTYGTDDKSLTAGLAVAYGDDGFADQPAATLGGEYRFSRRVALVGESWFIPTKEEEGALFLAGVRFFGEQITVDLGFAYAYSKKEESNDPFQPDTDDDTAWLPYIDFVWNF